MKTIAITVMAICLMSFSLAACDGFYYPGETEVCTNEMGIENLVYTIIGNSSPVPPLNVTINSLNITIVFPQDMIPDKFDIVFIEEQIKEVEKEKIVYRRGGSSGGIRYVDRNVTVPQPVFYDRNITNTETIEVESIVDNTTVSETGFKTWHILFAMVVGGAFIFSIMLKKKQKSAEKIMEEVEEDRIKEETEAKKTMEELGDATETN